MLRCASIAVLASIAGATVGTLLAHQNLSSSTSNRRNPLPPSRDIVQVTYRAEYGSERFEGEVPIQFIPLMRQLFEGSRPDPQNEFQWAVLGSLSLITSGEGTLDITLFHLGGIVPSAFMVNGKYFRGGSDGAFLSFLQLMDRQAVQSAQHGH